MTGTPDRPWRNFYGRTRGKTLRPLQRERLEGLLPTLTLQGVTREENPGREVLAGLPAPLWLEVGFGGGEHLVHMAGLHPEVTILGAEPFVNGIAQFLGKLEAAGVENIRLHPGDARDLLEVLPEASVEKAFLNYPDPWPKARHHRRRFVTPESLGLLARVMAKGAEFRVATDIEDYVRQTLEEVPPAGFALERGPTDEAWPDWLSTRYEQKALREGRRPHYMTFRRR
ncbi:tRNA (guanine46-N7-)-methyltransferase [Rubellimicrobium mesophilum DSM 19309]|uniref:tRNA (guanine-N(7)-)-methyltransferase n=1 Tax=Rubellimicrobium mesophilum DSM 19309 TaxID=442562 RepID=A0A017HCR9_9RHOB|nr:tRNA (guanine(46)-N(7))-methyltransferase TrmB [Rubellimicrobium mesophilum]EYD71554.1 tRNA (guanine46-N7-)-methyltransferase [Rubellimicrobium mesophilum DSM 19309]